MSDSDLNSCWVEQHNGILNFNWIHHKTPSQDFVFCTKFIIIHTVHLLSDIKVYKILHSTHDGSNSSRTGNCFHGGHNYINTYSITLK